MSCIQAHIELCEKVHQKKYYELKLLERGRQMLEDINKMDASCEKSYDRKEFF